MTHHTSLPIAALLPPLLIAIPFIIYCWYDVIKSERVVYLPKWAWLVLCSNLLGCIAYLLFGREK